MSPHPPARQAKFRQAAFFYLHLAILYESIVWVLHRQGSLPAERGSVWVWLLAGALIAGAVFWALWWKESVWVARLIWLVGLFRLPTIVEGAFVPAPGAALGPGFWTAALVVVLINLWLLARAGWDL